MYFKFVMSNFGGFAKQTKLLFSNFCCKLLVVQLNPRSFLRLTPNKALYHEAVSMDSPLPKPCPMNRSPMRRKGETISTPFEQNLSK